MELVEKKFDDQDAWIKTTVEKVKEVVAASEDAIVIGLAGGSTPKPIYEALNGEDLPWERLHFISIDERYVSVEDESSNLGMIEKAMPKARVKGFDTRVPIEESAEDMHMMMYGMNFDLLLLGMGADGHIASLFPGSSALECTDYATYLSVEGLDVSERLTLTLECLKRSKEAVLLVHGEEKEKVLESALDGEDLPVTRFLDLVDTQIYSY